VTKNKEAQSSNILMARIHQPGLPCYIAGIIVNKTRLKYRTLKDFNGVGIFKTVLKSDVHLSCCEHCPKEGDVLSALPNIDTLYENFEEHREDMDLSMPLGMT